MFSFIPAAVRRFLRYALVGGGTFAFDLLLLWATTFFWHTPIYIATPAAFLIAVSLNYFISRHFVFKGTERPVHHGYGYFIFIAAGGALFITGAVTLLTFYIGLNYLIARTLVACVVGIGNYLLNLHLNFKVVGKHQQ